MIIVEILLYSYLAEQVGKSKMIVRLPDKTNVYNFFVILNEKYPEFIQKYFKINEGMVISNLIVMIDGENLYSINALNTFLENNSKILFVPNIFGG